MVSSLRTGLIGIGPFIAIFLLTKLLYAPFYGLSTGFSGCLAQWGHSYSIGCWLFNHLQAFGNFGKEGGAGSFGFQYAVLQDRDGIFRCLRRGEAAEPVIEQLVPCCIKLACLGGAGLACGGAAGGFGGVADAILDRLVHNAYRINLKGESMRKRVKKLTTPGTSD